MQSHNDPAHILVIEDDAATLQSLVDLLLATDYRVTGVGDGAAALAVMDRDEVEVVLTDIRLPEVDGIELLRQSRSRSLPPEVILLTGYATMETAIAAVKSGAFNYLIKPSASAELLENVQRAVQRYRAERQLRSALQSLARAIEQQLDIADIAELAPPPRQNGNGAAAPPRTALISLDSTRYEAAVSGTALNLTRTEFLLLERLSQANGGVCTSQELIRYSHDQLLPEAEAQTLVRPHIRNLRRKLPPGTILNVRGVGYRLINPTAPEA